MATQNRNTDPNFRDLNSRDLEASLTTRPVTRDEVAYRDGYVSGKTAEQLEYDRRRAAEARMYEENARLRADNGVSTGLILGFVLAGVAAVVGGLLYVYNDIGGGAATPTPEATTPQQPSNDTTIIQRTIERTREVVPAPAQIQLPDVNVDVTPPPATTPEAEQPNPAADAQTPEQPQ
jgi:hypothetical protein